MVTALKYSDRILGYEEHLCSLSSGVRLTLSVWEVAWAVSLALTVQQAFPPVCLSPEISSPWYITQVPQSPRDG